MVLGWFWACFCFSGRPGIVVGFCNLPHSAVLCQRLSRQISAALGANYGLFFFRYRGRYGRILSRFSEKFEARGALLAIRAPPWPLFPPGCPTGGAQGAGEYNVGYPFGGHFRHLWALNAHFRRFFVVFCRALCRERVFSSFWVVPGTLETIKYSKTTVVLHENRGSPKPEKRGPGVDLGSILEARGHNFRALWAIFGDLGCILEHQTTSRI